MRLDCSRMRMYMESRPLCASQLPQSRLHSALGAVAEKRECIAAHRSVHCRAGSAFNNLSHVAPELPPECTAAILAALRRLAVAAPISSALSLTVLSRAASLPLLHHSHSACPTTWSCPMCTQAFAIRVHLATATRRPARLTSVWTMAKAPETPT